MSSVLGLKFTPKKVTTLSLILFLRIFSSLFVRSTFLFSLDVITLLRIDSSVLNFLAVSIYARVSFGKQDPP